MSKPNFPQSEVRQGMRTVVQHLLDSYPGEIQTLFDILAEEAHLRAEQNIDCIPTFSMWAKTQAGCKLTLMLLQPGGKADLIQALYGE